MEPKTVNDREAMVFSIRDMLEALGWNVEYPDWYANPEMSKRQLLQQIAYNTKNISRADAEEKWLQAGRNQFAKFAALKRELERRNSDYAKLCKKYQRVTRELHEIKHNIARDEFYGDKR